MQNKFNLTALKYKLLYIKSKNFRDQVIDTENLEKDYMIFLERFNELIDKLHLNDPIEIFFLYNHMLSNGYLSKDGVFTPTNANTYDEVINVVTLMGANLMNGKGACLHLSKGLSDIFNYRGVQSDLLPVYLEVDSKNKPAYANIYANHVISITRFNDKKFLLDPLNNSICKLMKDNPLYLKSKDLFLKQKIILDEMDRINYDERLKSIIKTLVLPENRLLDDASLYADTRAYLEKEKKQIIAFANNNESLFEDIAGKIEKYKDSYDYKVKI